MFSLLFISIQALLRLVFLKYIFSPWSLFQAFEDNIRKNRTIISNWIKYAQWEESLQEVQRYRTCRTVNHLSCRTHQKPACHSEFLLEYSRLSASSAFRARSIYERALDVDHRNITLWLKYAEMEMKNRQVNHARNIWDRAITILPRANQFWYKWC